MSEKNTMTRNAMLFLPAKIAKGILLMAMSSLYSHILTKSAVGLLQCHQYDGQLYIPAHCCMDVELQYTLCRGGIKKDHAAKLFSTIVPIYFLLCAITGAVCVGMYAFTEPRGLLPAGRSHVLYLFCIHGAQ